MLHDSHTASPVTTHTVRTDLDKWTPQLSNTAHSCTHHVPFTPWFTSEWPDNIIPLPKTFIVMTVHCLSPCDAVSHYQTTRSVNISRESANKTPFHYTV